ncbi:MAG TPA: NAD(P)H-hydrate dehydratase [Bacteroidales bacterium]|nr:NAD(P)H-hydrate dehydratase [Bacteroidales bacterium]HSA43319.1 NAD(P)H-hydrate dehydratase [Bacteroidales bacterium]
MKKVLNTAQIRQADAYTIEHEPVASVDLMERAATACTDWVLDHFPADMPVCIFCGMGNNGGDGLVMARLLAAGGRKVRVFLVMHSDKATPDHETNLQRFKDQALGSLNEIHNAADLSQSIADELMIDALLGSGLNKAVTGLLQDVIHFMNRQPCFRLSIDVPSGFFCDRETDPDAGAVVHASHTLTFEVPRLAFFFPEAWKFTGDWTLIPIGLDREFIAKAESRYFLVEEEDIRTALKPRPRFAHKGHFGHGLLISGSYGRMGAAVLGTRAALRSGAGLVTTHIPAEGCHILQTAVPEGMVSIDRNKNCFSHLPELSAYDAIAVGPGSGTSDETATALKLLIQNTPVPLILDADALNILSLNKTWLSFLPPGSILTPHPKEFERLTEKTTSGFSRNILQREFSVKYQLYVVLKGAFSCVSFPDGNMFFNPTGNPGMATAGSGDVLTGILLGLMAQGHTASFASLAAAYLHGLAGDIACSGGNEHALIAGDIIEALPQAFAMLSE